MGPRLIDMRWDEPDQAVLGLVAGHLAEGGLVAMPTETVYGFGCVPEIPPLTELQRLKDRGPEKPFLLLIPRAETVPELEWVREARELAAVFWPGALTLILNDPTERYPAGIRSSTGGVAVRVSPHPLAESVLTRLGGPLVSTSANGPGGLPALSAEEALATAKELGADDRLWVLDGGPLSPSESSTIVDCTGSMPVIRRLGAIPLNRLRCVLPEIHESS
jgi:L-threonylcarbamoyladenylate synthase